MISIVAKQYLNMPHARGELALMAGYRWFNVAAEATVDLAKDAETQE